ncbi:glycosyltransferase family 2 protein [Paenibacillus rhizophilus]|uniref:Glycosyltransferase family 2 protein n=1 Tax=Paenibacillus rhizophilus TaxID=1850366 RepID=A0A3N9PW34_9BACL|nr:glycosyltransferase family A protein [Paenibacillus rhizophilus]RQW10632.1 glycosyltransferase family 2 protein [Paenibacillus rhizophilus]
MKPEISIIMPIYNMEAYLQRSLDSLLNQTFGNLEIIAVNDGSTDGSLSILRQYAGRDDRIIPINRNNGGVSSARNEGIRNARGRYIAFVDPDDWVKRDMFMEMREAAEREEADIVMCTYMREFGTHAKEKVFPLPDMKIYRHQEVQDRITRRLFGPLREELAEPDYLDAWGTVWGKLYRADLIKRAAASFIDLETIGTNEDSLFNIHVCHHARSFVFLGRPFYHYWKANTSSITSRHNPLLESKFNNLYGHMKSYIRERGLPEEYTAALHNRICVNTLGLGLNIISEDYKASAFTKIKEIRALVVRPEVASCFAGFELQYCTGAWKIFFLLGKWKMAAGMYFMLNVINRLRMRKTGGVDNGARSNSAGRHRHEQGRTGNDAHELLSPDGPRRHSV